MQYNPSFVDHRPILTAEEKLWLHGFAAKFSLSQFKNDARHYEETTVDFVYTSAKIEGNTYDRIDTDNLLRLGLTAGGKRYSDAIMLVNLRDGFEKVMAAGAATELNIDYFCDLHKVLMRDLLPIHEQGIVRTTGVTIGASVYEPPVDSGHLRSEIKFILPGADKYDDPFERSIYLHCNLAYLQYFRDGNKRTSRMMQTAALVQGNVLPLFFSDTLIDKYQRATVLYYETGQYAPYVAFFKENYELAISKRIGHKQPAFNIELSASASNEFDRRVSHLPKLEQYAGTAHTFWALAQEAMVASGSPEAVNWPDIERRAIVKSIAQNGQPPESVAAVICKYSPGASSVEEQQSILADIERLAPDLEAQYATARNKRMCEP